MTSTLSNRGLTTQLAANGDQVTIGDENVANETRSLDDLYQRLASHDRGFTSSPATSRSSIQVAPNQLTIGDDNYALDEYGWGRLATQFKSTPDYWATLDPTFRSSVAQYHFDRFDHLSLDARRNDVDAVAFNGTFLGFRPSHLLHLASADVLRAIRDGLGADADHFTVNRLQMTRESVVVELTTQRISREVQPGDDIQGGIAFSHSMIGEHATTVDLFTLRLLCRNGMSLRQCLGSTEISRGRRIKRRDDLSVIAAMDQIERMTRERIKHLVELLSSFSSLPGNAVDRSKGATDEDAMRHFLMPQLRVSHLWSDALWTRVLAPAWQHEHGGRGELTEFAAVNTITYVATHHDGLTFRQRRTLARLAGLLAYRRVHVCPRCHQAVIGA